MTEPWERPFAELERRLDSLDGLTRNGVFIRRELFDVYMTQLSADVTEVKGEVAGLRVEMQTHEREGQSRREAEVREKRAFQRSLILLVIGALFSGVLSLIVAVLNVGGP